MGKRVRKRARSVSISIAVSIAAACGSASAAQAAGSASGSVGTWVLDCPDNACTLRHVHPLFARAGVTAQLEVRASGAGRVPVVAVRGLPRDPLLSTAVGEGIRATLQLGNQAPALLACGLAGEAYLCQPTGTAAAALSRELPDAGSVTIALAAALPGQEVQPIGKRTLDLAGTQEALARLPTRPTLAEVPTGETGPQPIPRGWLALLDKGLKAAGYPNGSADLSALLSRYLQH
jgi:hypothetical protein